VGAGGNYKFTPWKASDGKSRMKGYDLAPEMFSNGKRSLCGYKYRGGGVMRKMDVSRKRRGVDRLPKVS